MVGVYGQKNSTALKHEGVSVSPKRSSRSSHPNTPNKQDARYLKTEDRIFRALGVCSRRYRLGLKIRKLCDYAKMAESTFYRHYKSPTQAIEQKEQQVQKEFADLLHQLKNKRLSFRQTYMHFLIFIKHHHYFFDMLPDIGYESTLVKMIEKLYLQFYKEPNHRNKNQCCSFYVYCKEVVGILYWWCTKEQCSNAKIESCLDKVVFLTNNFKHKLCNI